ncbi:unnamed protein product [Allacma fusca]|uniref:EF-hand domain-containing protein n=1 Tax=Allacma fusca TaxID=39272 RepID=A0A8J2K6U8_9HEXA|nr:unnamed protein product [Allacma fusca]
MYKKESSISPSETSDVSSKETTHGRFFNVVKNQIALADGYSMIRNDESTNHPRFTPIERHAAKIHDLLRRDSKILVETRSIQSFTSLVSKAMSAAMSTSEAKLPGTTNIKKTKTPKSGGNKPEEAPSKRLSRNIAQLQKTTHFSIAEVGSLIRMFHAFTSRSKTPGQMDLQLFREIFQKHFGIMDDIMLDHMFYYFDNDRKGYIGESQWVTHLSTILRGTIQEHIDFCYEVYKLGSGGSDESGIKRPQVRTLLQGCFATDSSGSSEEDSNHHELVDLAIKILGRYTLGYITIESFTTAVLTNPLTIQALGTCLPDLSKLKSFMALFAEDYNNYRSNYSLPNDSSYKGKKFFIVVRKRKT